MAKKKSRVLLNQKIALSVGLAAVAGVIIYVSTIVVTDIPMGDYQLGVHYEEVENPRRLRAEKIEVMEFFSYGCIHCYNLESELQKWLQKNSDKINYVRSPAMFDDAWHILGQSYYTTEVLAIKAQNHLAFFHEIQIRKNPLTSLDRLASYFDGKGTTSAEYKTAFNSPATKRMVAAADQRQRRFRISSVPTIIVNGKFRVQTSAKVGRSRLLDVVDYLVDREIAGKTKPATR